MNHSNQQLDQVANVLGWTLVLVLLAGAILADCTTNQARGNTMTAISYDKISDTLGRAAHLVELEIEEKGHPMRSKDSIRAGEEYTGDLWLFDPEWSSVFYGDAFGVEPAFLFSATGIGEVSDLRNLNYLGYLVRMTAGQFLRLNPKRPTSHEVRDLHAHLDQLHEAKELNMARPFLTVRHEAKDTIGGKDRPHWQVTGHEGRGRVEWIAKRFGRDALIEVAIFPRERGCKVDPMRILNHPFKRDENADPLPMFESPYVTIKEAIQANGQHGRIYNLSPCSTSEFVDHIHRVARVKRFTEAIETAHDLVYHGNGPGYDDAPGPMFTAHADQYSGICRETLIDATGAIMGCLQRTADQLAKDNQITHRTRTADPGARTPLEACAIRMIETFEREADQWCEFENKIEQVPDGWTFVIRPFTHVMDDILKG